MRHNRRPESDCIQILYIASPSCSISLHILHVHSHNPRDRLRDREPLDPPDINDCAIYCKLKTQGKKEGSVRERVQGDVNVDKNEMMP